MHKQHEQKIKQDEADYQNLSLQVEKVQKLKRQHSLQKQQIKTLKDAIQDLKSQNQDLKSISCKNSKSRSKFNNEELQPRQNKKKQKSWIEKDNVNENQTNLYQNQKKNSQAQTKYQNKNKLQNQMNSKVKNQKVKLNCRKLELNQEEMQNPTNGSFGNRSGFFSTGRLLSPQYRSNLNYNKTYDGRYQKYLNKTETWGDQVQLKFDQNYIATKNRLIDNFVNELKYQIEQKNEMLHQQKVNHKSTKKTLKQTCNENQKLTQMNYNLLSNFDLLQKQNEFLKQQIIKQTQSKIKAEQIRRDIGHWHKRYYEQFQLEMLAMDAIYYDFERICSLKTI